MSVRTTGCIQIHDHTHSVTTVQARFNPAGRLFDTVEKAIGSLQGQIPLLSFVVIQRNKT